MKKEELPDEETEQKSEETQTDSEFNLNVQIDFQKFNQEQAALVFSTKDSGYAKWLLAQHFAEIAQECEQFAYQLTETNESQAERAEIRQELEAK